MAGRGWVGKGREGKGGFEDRELLLTLGESYRRDGRRGVECLWRVRVGLGSRARGKAMQVSNAVVFVPCMHRVLAIFSRPCRPSCSL